MGMLSRKELNQWPDWAVILASNTRLVPTERLKGVPVRADSRLWAVSKPSALDDNFLKLLQCTFIPIWE